MPDSIQANLNTVRDKIRDAVAILPSGMILLAGGGARPEVFDLVIGIFAPVAGSIGTTRYYATVTLLQNGEVLILGGDMSGSQSGILERVVVQTVISFQINRRTNDSFDKPD